MAVGSQPFSEHIENVHRWPAELMRPDATDAYFDLLHGALHEQSAAHIHRWVVVEFHSGIVVSAPCETEENAQERAIEAFGPDAGKEFGVYRYVEELFHPGPDPCQTP